MSQQPLGTCIIVTNLQNQILLGKRINSYKSGSWGLPGGRIELGESLKLAAARELTEETSLHPSRIFHLCTIREYQQSLDFIHFAFHCSKFNGQPQTMEPDKCTGWQWFSHDSFPTPILPAHQVAINFSLNPADSTLIDLPKRSQ